ncbi:MAG: sugar phosphate isomerase/epimerase [Candidatus Hydrogenedentes bacterium]|nr:sugar phosphate isomerase/epimerase [Candidatus Hydrogenedentota bacterium]
MSSRPFALQLYTVREQLDADFAGTVRRVKEIGYDAAELAGFGGHTPDEAAAMLADAGLTVTSSHFGLDQIAGEPGAVLEVLGVLGTSYAVVSAGAPDEEGWRQVAEKLALGGAALHDAGCTLCYHNHAHEFGRIGDRYILDYLLEETEDAHVAAEIDTYWVRDGGEDPVALIRKYAGRCPLLHVKDMTPGEPHTFAEVGQGVIDWAPIFTAAGEAGVKWYIVEQDRCAGDPVDSARISADFMAAQ